MQEKYTERGKMDTEATRALISLPYRGPVNNTLEDIVGGVRSACTYIGARRLKDMAKCASFVTTHNVINRVYERYTK